MASFTKQPPILQGKELYAEWKKDIEMWFLFSDLLKEKQGSAVFLSLPQNIHECVWHLGITDIGWTDELWVIMDNLDKIYLCDKHTMAFKDFYSNKRTAGVNINKFLVQFSLMSRLFTNGLGDRGSIPGRVISKTHKNGTWCRLA